MLLITVLGVAMGCGADEPSPAGATPPAVSSVGADEVESPETTERATDATTITIEASRFSTVEVTVDVGTTVVWENDDPYAHTITSSSGGTPVLDSGEFGQGERFEYTFEQPGEYPYFCQIHPTMRAIVIVE